MRWRKHREAQRSVASLTHSLILHRSGVPDGLREAKPPPFQKSSLLFLHFFFHAFLFILMTRPTSLCSVPPPHFSHCSWTLSPVFQSETDVCPLSVRLFSFSVALFTAPSLSPNNVMKCLQNLGASSRADTSAHWISGFDSAFVRQTPEKRH